MLLVWERSIVAYNAEITYRNVNKYLEKEISESRGIGDCKEVNQIMEEVVTRWLYSIGSNEVIK